MTDRTRIEAPSNLYSQNFCQRLLPLVKSYLLAECPAAAHAARATALKAGMRASFLGACPFTFENIRGRL